ncbi:hypothetical protein OIDMADRAFT_29242 [Oidiodendron maius Zn]|uniref:Transcription factor domain-containing protein n=1 Tax=Oidiodendron maius (strain Zn) TaxID=913774 RepID=A0A0C3HA73_OIDMZ|nr:hypothetical protein OIDMADRAFT_29242 [Oidiodendron maius Zn]
MPCIQQLSEGPHYSAKHLLDLRLMHHYSVFASEYFTRKFPEKVSIELKVNIPRLALEHDFLMDALLLVSMIHLGCTNPISLESLPVYLYRDQALRALRKAVADISQQTIDAVRGASVLLATVSFATDRVTRQPGLWAANWLTHVAGQRNFRTSASHRQKSTLSYTQDGMESPSHLYKSFTDIPAPGVIAIDIQRALSREEHDNNWPHRTALYNAALELGRLITILEHPYDESWLEKKIKAWAFDVVPSEFVELVRQAQPHALVILAYYLALFKFLPDTWTYEGVANHDIEHIQKTIDPTWEEYLTVPKMALQMDDRIALAQVFVSCLPGRGQDPELQ